jgi:hypothetical protein
VVSRRRSVFENSRRMMALCSSVFGTQGVTPGTALQVIDGHHGEA